MRLLLVSVLLLSFVLSGCWKEPKHPNWSNSAGAEQYERLMWQAIRDKDWVQVERHLAPMFVGVDVSGHKFDQVGWVEHWKSTPVREFNLGEVAVHPNGADMVITYELRLDNSKPVRVVSVWQQLKKGWVLTTQSATPVMGADSN
jgi:uncharacterized protein DUF4440